MKIKFKNILSYGNKFQELEFKNGIDIIVGKNGRGKSVLLDALNFVLFGKPYRNIKIGQLVNNINQKELVVELEFQKNNKNYKIVRGIKPNIFEIYEEGKLLSQHGHSKDYQELIERILGFNEMIFKQIIALGTNLTGNKNFFEISQKDRSKLFQKLTGTYIINVVLQLAREKKNLLKTKLENENYKLLVNKNNLQHNKENIKKLERQREAFIKNKHETLQKIQTEIDNILKRINELKNEKVEDPTPYEEKLKELLEKQNILNNKKVEIETNLSHPYTKCPKCGYSSVDLDKLKSKLKTIEIALEKIGNKINDLTININKIYDHKNRILNELSKNEFKLSSLKEKYNEIEKQTDIVIDYSIIKSLEKEINEIENRISDLEEQIKIYDDIISLINDENFINAVLNNYLPTFNRSANLFLEKYDLNYHITIDNKYNLIIKEKNEEINFWQLSNGQKQRIILSILFAFIELMEQNGFSFPVLILDEFLDSSMDEEGINDTINVLKTFNNKNVIIITHNDKIINKIEADRIFEVSSNFKFSQIKELS